MLLQYTDNVPYRQLILFRKLQLTHKKTDFYKKFLKIIQKKSEMFK
jgi:hypothetical protein